MDSQTRRVANSFLVFLSSGLPNPVFGRQASEAACLGESRFGHRLRHAVDLLLGVAVEFKLRRFRAWRRSRTSWIEESLYRVPCVIPVINSGAGGTTKRLLVIASRRGGRSNLLRKKPRPLRAAPLHLEMSIAEICGLPAARVLLMNLLYQYGSYTSSMSRPLLPRYARVLTPPAPRRISL